MASAKALRVLLILGLALGLGASAGAQVSGKLLLGAYKPEIPSATSGAFNWELENGFKEVLPDRLDVPRELAVVLLADGPATALERVEIPISGGSMMPSTLVVRAGATVIFRNDDEIAHETFAEGLDTFAAEAISPRGRRSLVFPTSGHWPVRDRLLPHVNGHMHVLPNLVAIATVAADGQYTFTNLTPGKYVLKVFHGAGELISQSIELTTRGLTVDPLTLTPKGP
jgi:plastocyanin